MDFRETIKKSEYIYKGKILTLRKDLVILPNKKEATREIIEHNGGVCVLAIKDDIVSLVKQYRHPYEKEILELPAGKLEMNEDPYEAGIRELEEEVGIKTKKLCSLGYSYPSPGYSNEIIYMFYTEEFEMTNLHLDEDEFLEPVKVNINDLYKMIENNELVDAKSIITILKYKLTKEK